MKVPEDFVARFLDHTVFDGWGRRALNAAAQDVGLDKVALRRVAPNGPRTWSWRSMIWQMIE